MAKKYEAIWLSPKFKKHLKLKAVKAEMSVEEFIKSLLDKKCDPKVL